MANKYKIGIIVVLSILIAGCLGEDTNSNKDEGNDFNYKSDFYYHTYKMTITPHNLTINGSPEFSVGIPFLIPVEEPLYWVNRTHFTPNNLQIEFVYNESADEILMLTCPSTSAISFVLNRNEKPPYESYYSTDGVSTSLTIWYNGDYEYLNIDYYGYWEHGSNEGGGYKEASFNGNVTHGWNSCHAVYETDDW